MLVTKATEEMCRSGQGSAELTRLALGAMQKRGGIETDEEWGERRGQGLAGLGKLGEIVKEGTRSLPSSPFVTPPARPSSGDHCG